MTKLKIVCSSKIYFLFFRKLNVSTILYVVNVSSFYFLKDLDEQKETSYLIFFKFSLHINKVKHLKLNPKKTLL